MNEHFRVNEAGRADKIVAARFPGVGRRRLAELFARGAVRVNGRVARKGDKIAPGAEMTLSETPEADFAPAPDPELELDVLYADDDIVVVNKPAGVPSHPLRPHEHRTLANALVARFPDCAEAGREAEAGTDAGTEAAGAHRREAGLVHRLDTGTSGAIMAARHPRAWRAMRAAFGRGEVEKRYLALVQSADIGTGECAAPLAHRGNRMIVADQDGADSALPATTRWRVIARLSGFALLECTARTGRMHQVRVHLAHAGAPIVGDALYRGPVPPGAMEPGHFLHASALGFTHPITGAPMRIEAPLPRDRQALLDALA
jgi:23S rRNA pseudouridine1911/1915/1917 synthase